MINIVNKDFEHLVPSSPKISFVKDRLSHRHRYAINFNKLIKKNKMENHNFLNQCLYQTIKYYLNIKINKKIINSIKRIVNFDFT